MKLWANRKNRLASKLQTTIRWSHFWWSIFTKCILNFLQVIFFCQLVCKILSAYSLFLAKRYNTKQTQFFLLKRYYAALDATIFLPLKTWKKNPSKVLIGPIFFSVLSTGSKPAQISISVPQKLLTTQLWLCLYVGILCSKRILNLRKI